MCIFKHQKKNTSRSTVLFFVAFIRVEKKTNPSNPRTQQRFPHRYGVSFDLFLFFFSQFHVEHYLGFSFVTSRCPIRIVWSERTSSQKTIIRLGLCICFYTIGSVLTMIMEQRALGFLAIGKRLLSRSLFFSARRVIKESDSLWFLLRCLRRRFDALREKKKKRKEPVKYRRAYFTDSLYVLIRGKKYNVDLIPTKGLKSIDVKEKMLIMDVLSKFHDFSWSFFSHLLLFYFSFFIEFFPSRKVVHGVSQNIRVRFKWIWDECILRALGYESVVIDWGWEDFSKIQVKTGWGSILAKLLLNYREETKAYWWSRILSNILTRGTIL